MLEALKPEERRSWLQKILDVIRKLINKIKGVDNSFEEDLRNLEKKFSKMLKETAKNEKSTGEGVKYSVKPFAEQIDDVLDGTFERSNAVFVGETPKILKSVGLNDSLPMLTTAKHIRNANKPKNTKKHHHGLTKNQIKSLPAKIAGPVMIMDSLDATKNSIVVVTDMVDIDKSPVIVSIKTDGKGMYNNVEINSNFLTGYYGRDGFSNFIENNVLGDTFLYINKEKATKLSTESSSSWLEQLKDYDFNVIIRKTKANVNKKLSVTPEKESEYMSAVENKDTETEQKLVDEAAANAGYTQKAYHGTGADFNIFSEENIGKRNVWGKGFYFGTSKGIADDYASLRASNGGKYRIVNAYLKMDNPYTPHKSDLGTAKEIKDRWFSDMWANSRELGINYIQGKLDNSPLDLLQFIAEHNNIEVQDVLKEYGYDSVKDGGELVVFNPNQIKSADPVTYDDNGNVIPLSERFNEEETDIRYSIPNTSSRAELADALSTLTQDEYEKRIIEDYNNKKGRYEKHLPFNF